MLETCRRTLLACARGHIHIASFPFLGQPAQLKPRRSLEGGVEPLFSARSEASKGRFLLADTRASKANSFEKELIAPLINGEASCRARCYEKTDVTYPYFQAEQILVAVTRKARILGSWYGT